MPKLLYGCGEPTEPRYIWYSCWDKKIATCPNCKQVDRLKDHPPPSGYDDELGVCWFKCGCGVVFKMGGLYEKMEVP